MGDESTTIYFSALQPLEQLGARTTSRCQQSLSSALSTLEELVEQGHVNTHAHVIMSNCLKAAFESVDADRSDDLRGTAVLFVTQVPWLIDLFRPNSQGQPPAVDVLDETFMKSLFLKRVAYDARVGERTDGGVDSQWLAQVLGFYLPSVERVKATMGDATVDNFCVAYTDRLRGTLMQLLRATSDEALAPVRSALVTYIVHHQEMPPLLHVCPNLFRPEWTAIPSRLTFEAVNTEFAASYRTLMQMGDDDGDGDTPDNAVAAQFCLVATDAKFVQTLLYNAPGLVNWVFERSGKLLDGDFRSASCVGRKLAQSHPHRFWLPFMHDPRRVQVHDESLTVCAEVSPLADDPSSPHVTFTVM